MSQNTGSKKYLLCPGYVTSRTDGDRHFIDARRLRELYGVRSEDCEIYNEYLGMVHGYFHDSMIRLYPRADGNYSLPSPTERSI